MDAFPTPHLETERLVLTWPTLKQIQGFYDAIIGTNMFDTILWEGPERIDDLVDWWEENRKRDPNDSELTLSLAMIEKSSGKCVGGMGLAPKQEEPITVTISYTIAPVFQGKGYATESVRGLVEEAFTHRGVQRIRGPVFIGNEASKRVLEKAGFQLTGITPNALEKRGVSIDLWELSVTRKSWEEQSQG